MSSFLVSILSNSDIDSIRSDVNDLESDISAVDGYISTLQSTTSSLSTSVSTLTTASNLVATTATMIFYVDGSATDDTGDGLSLGTAKKTLQAVFDLIPFIVRHSVIVNIKNTLDQHALVGSARKTTLNKYIANSGLILIDGGTDETIVAGPFTSTSASATALTDSGQSWTVDAYFGYWAKITSGGSANVWSVIQENTATTITPCRNFSPVPSAGATFSVVKPTTQISHHTGGVAATLEIQCSGPGIVYLQRFRLNGASLNPLIRGRVECRGVIVEDVSAFTVTNAEYFAALSNLRDNSDPTAQITTPQGCGGLSYLDGVGVGFVSIPVVNLQPMLNKQASTALRDCGASGVLAAGSRFKATVTYTDPKRVGSSATASSINNSSGFAITRFEGTSGTSPALLLQGGGIVIGTGVSFTASSASGIDCDGCRLRIDGAIVGTVGKFDVYVHGGGICQVKNGSMPAITATTGEFSFDNTTIGGTWTDVDAGAPVFSPNEMSLVTEI